MQYIILELINIAILCLARGDAKKENWRTTKLFLKHVCETLFMGKKEKKTFFKREVKKTALSERGTSVCQYTCSRYHVYRLNRLSSKMILEVVTIYLHPNFSRLASLLGFDIPEVNEEISLLDAQLIMKS